MKSVHPLTFHMHGRITAVALKIPLHQCTDFGHRKAEILGVGAQYVYSLVVKTNQR